MALILTKETGTGSATSNSYVTLAEAETFMEGRSHTVTWDAATSTDELKNEALANAASILDQQFVWRGDRTLPSTQAMHWPRTQVTEPDRQVDNNEIPRAIRDAQVILAQGILASEAFFTRDPAAGGADQIAGINLGQGALKIDYQPQSAEGAASNRYKTVVDGEIIALLAPYGRFRQGGSMKRVRRG